MFNSNNNKLENEVKQLKKENADLQADYEKLLNRLEEANSTIEDFGQEKTTISKKNIEYKKNIESLKLQHKTDLDKMEKSVYQKVNATLASMGVDTFVTEYFSDNQPSTDIDKMKTFMSLTGNDKTEYYNKNKEAITRSLLNNKS